MLLNAAEQRLEEALRLRGSNRLAAAAIGVETRNEVAAPASAAVLQLRHPGLQRLEALR